MEEGKSTNGGLTKKFNNKKAQILSTSNRSHREVPDQILIKTIILHSTQWPNS
jgi:hypothetical protein